MTTLSSFTDFAVGDAIEINRAISGLVTAVASLTFGIDGIDASAITIDVAGSPLGQVLDAGSGDPFLATYALLLDGTWTRTYFTPGVTTRCYVDVTCTDGKTYTPALIDFTPQRGGAAG